jgi:hypothetical protein
MAAKLTILTHKIAIQLHLVAESCTICNSRFRRPVQKLLDTLYTKIISAEIRHMKSDYDDILKVQAKLSLCLTKHHAMKTYWGSGGIAPRIL